MLNMDILDKNRLEETLKALKEYRLQDVMVYIQEALFELRKRELDHEYKINEWTVDFDESFNKLYHDTKLILIDMIGDRYPDFDDIISKTSNRMHLQFQESGKSKLYMEGIPDTLSLKHMIIDKERKRLSFVIVVHENGKRGRSYHMSAGKFFVPWDYN